MTSAALVYRTHFIIFDFMINPLHSKYGSGKKRGKTFDDDVVQPFANGLLNLTDKKETKQKTLLPKHPANS